MATERSELPTEQVNGRIGGDEIWDYGNVCIWIVLVISATFLRSLWTVELKSHLRLLPYVNSVLLVNIGSPGGVALANSYSWNTRKLNGSLRKSQAAMTGQSSPEEDFGLGYVHPTSSGPHWETLKEGCGNGVGVRCNFRDPGKGKTRCVPPPLSSLTSDTSDQMCVSFLPWQEIIQLSGHQLGVLEFSTTWRWCQTPQVQGSVPLACSLSPPLQMPTENPRCCLDWLHIGGSTTPSLCL